MKNNILFFSLIFITGSLFAQFSSVGFKSDEYLQFKASKTHVVLTGDQNYDEAIKKAMNDNWKITPFDFISPDSLKTTIRDKNSSFIALITVQTSTSNQAFHYFALFNGGKKNIQKYDVMDMLAYCPINYWRNESPSTLCAPRVENMLQAMVNTIEILQKKEIAGLPKKITDQLIEYYNQSTPKIKNRILLLSKEAIGDKLDEKSMASVYPYKFEICSQEKVNKAIKEKSKDYYYFQPGITLSSNKFVIDPSNGEVIYADFDIMGIVIKKGDIESLVKAANPKK